MKQDLTLLCLMKGKDRRILHFFILLPEAYLGPYQASQMEIFFRK